MFVLSHQDPISAYMRDVHRYPVLSHEEQHELAVVYAETGDTKAAARLVTSNLRLVVKLVRNYKRGSAKDVLDLIQEGNLGLMHAVKKYDPYKGVKLTSYAGWWIKDYLIRFNMKNHRLIRIGTNHDQRKLFFNLGKEKDKLLSQGVVPTSEAIAEGLSVKVAEVEFMRSSMELCEASMDFQAKWEDGSSMASLSETLPAEGPFPEEEVADSEISFLAKDKIEEFCRSLTKREQHIFRERILSASPPSRDSIGDLFGVSKERIRQIELSLQSKVEEFLREELCYLEEHLLPSCQ